MSSNPTTKTFSRRVVSLAAGLTVGALLPLSAGAVSIVPACATGSAVPDVDCILQGFGNIAQVIIGVTGGLALIMFVYGGFLMLSSGGGDRAKKGMDTLKAAVVGIVIVLLAGYLVRYGLSQLKIDPDLLETPTASSSDEPASTQCTVERWSGSCSACTDVSSGTACSPSGDERVGTCQTSGSDLVCPEPSS